MRHGWWIAALLVASAAPPAAAADPREEDVRRAVESVLGDGSYQRDLPGREPPAESTSRAGAGSSDRPRRRPRPPGDPVALGVVLEAALWISVGIGAAWLAIWAFRGWKQSRESSARAPGSAAPAAAGPAPRPAPDAPAALDAIDAMAAAGRLDEAVHALLLRAIADLSRHGGGGIATDLTSREIARSLSLPAGARAAFSGLVDAVEASLFAGRPTDRAGFDAARGRYLDVRLAAQKGRA